MANGANDVIFFPDGNSRNSIDPALLLALGSGGMNNMNPFWMMFMLPFVYPFFGSMMGGWGNGWGGFGSMNGGAGFISNQLNNDAGRELIMQAVQGNRDAISSLATTLNTDFATVNTGIQQMIGKLGEIGSTVGMTGLQVINAVQSGDAAIASKLCECCCENRLAIANQTNALQAQAAANHAASTLQYAQGQAADQLAVCQQTNTLQTQSERNTNSILNAIAGQNTLITKEFCDLKERELQNKIDSLTADNALLRSNANTVAQTQQFAAMLGPIQAELAAIKAAQPATITLPNTQYTVVPTFAAAFGADFFASYLANRATSSTTPASGGGTTPTT